MNYRQKILKKLYSPWLNLTARHIDIKCEDYEATFELQSSISRDWFLPRYSLGNPHERSVLVHLINHLRKDDTFLDVGSHLGFYGIFAALKAKRVTCLEMDPETIGIIDKNADLNNLKNLEIILGAASDQDADLASFSPFQTNNRSTNTLTRTSGRITVPTFTLDTLCQRNNCTPSIIKIDVEGAEFRVIEGMRNIIQETNLRSIYLEVHPTLIDSFHSLMKTTGDFLRENNFDFQLFPEHRGKKIRGPKPLPEPEKLSSNCMLLCSRDVS